MDDEVLGSELVEDPETSEGEQDDGSEVYEGVVIEEDPRLFFETPFREYTVTEGLLLLLVLFAFISACVRIIKEGFSWL